MSFMRRDRERRRSNSLQLSRNNVMESKESSPKQTPTPSLVDLSRDELKNKSKRWKSGSFAKLFRLCGSNLSKAEQNRVRNLKTAPVIKSGHHHQPDLLNLSVATAETEADKEIRRLETLCESHGKEINRLKSLLEQRTMGFEAFTIFAKYMIEDLDAFAHPSTMRDFHNVRRSLDACKFDLDRAILEKENLQAKNADLIAAHQNELDKLRQGHENDVAAMKETIVKNYQEEIQKLEDDFTEMELLLKEKHEAELFELTQTNEYLYQEKLDDKIKELRSQQTMQINTIETEYDLKVEELTKDFNSINYNLEQQLQATNSKCSDLHRQKKEYEDALFKDNNYKLQIAAGKIGDLQKEIESLKAVIELRSCEIHELRAVSNKVQKLEEELYLSEDKIKLLSTKTEDLQAQVDIKNSKERQLSNEKQLLRGWFEKESKMNKRLSMENEELQWKLAQSMEAPSLTALYETSPNTSMHANNFMSTSTPVAMGASDGEEQQRSPRCKRSLPFSSSKIIPSQRAAKFERDERIRHHRQRFSISESEDGRDSSPASRYRRAQSLSWTVGLKSDDCDSKAAETEAIRDHPTTAEREPETEKTSAPEKKADEPENIIKLNGNLMAAHEIVTEATPASQAMMKRATLERRNSISPDARVPSLITAQYWDEQNSSRAKRERRSSLGSLKWGEESSFMSRSTRSLSSPHDYRKKTPRNSPIKTKNSTKITESMDLNDFEAQNDAQSDELVDSKVVVEEEKKMVESQESVSQRSMTDSEDFSAPLTISLKSDDRMSSCESSPLPGEPSQSSRSEDSSPRASPQFRSKMGDDSLCEYAMSPRMSAGECMITDENVDKGNEETVPTSDVLLRRTFPEFYAQIKSSGARDSSIEDNQGTPESGSLAILPTDSTNIDLSWSEDEDEIPSESEV